MPSRFISHHGSYSRRLGQWNGTISISHIFTQNWIIHLCIPPHTCMPVSMQGANSSGRDGCLVYLTRYLLNELNSECKLSQIWIFFVVCIKLSNYVESSGQASQWFGDIIFNISRRMFTTWFTLSEPSLWNILCLVANWARQSVSLSGFQVLDSTTLWHPERTTRSSTPPAAPAVSGAQEKMMPPAELHKDACTPVVWEVLLPMWFFIG